MIARSRARLRNVVWVRDAHARLPQLNHLAQHLHDSLFISPRSHPRTDFDASASPDFRPPCRRHSIFAQPRRITTLLPQHAEQSCRIARNCPEMQSGPAMTLKQTRPSERVHRLTIRPSPPTRAKLKRARGIQRRTGQSLLCDSVASGDKVAPTTQNSGPRCSVPHRGGPCHTRCKEQGRAS